MLKLSHETTVLSHFFNEEFLLPHWMKHHVNLFDHGIMIDYDSTDRSLEIIKDIAPNWDIIHSENEYFGAEECDREMMKYEEFVSGWKMVLNVTEFLLLSDLKEKLNVSENALRFHGFQINDSEEEYLTGFDNEKHILLQRFNGFSDPWRHRIIHRNLNGGYYVGRHYQTPGIKENPYVEKHHGDIPFGEDMFLLWYRFAPYQEQIPRKIQISRKIPQSDIDKGFGWNHWNLDEDKINERWQKVLPDCKDIRDNPKIKMEYETLLNSLN